MLTTDLFDFAFVPDWYGQLDELSRMALPEPWRFRKPINVTKNQDTPILERYIHWIVNIFLDNFFKVVFFVLYGCLISQRGMYSVMVVPVYIIP